MAFDENKTCENCLFKIILADRILRCRFNAPLPGSYAVSGEDKTNISISHFLVLNDDFKPEGFLGKDLLKFDDYIHEYSTSPKKFNQDYQKLLVNRLDLNYLNF